MIRTNFQVAPFSSRIQVHSYNKTIKISLRHLTDGVCLLIFNRSVCLEHEGKHILNQKYVFKTSHYGFPNFVVLGRNLVYSCVSIMNKRMKHQE